MRSRTHWGRPLKAAGLLLALACTYLAMLPATWLDALLQDASQGTLAVTATRGTLWRGEGSLQAVQPNGEAVTLVPVNWDIALGELLSLNLHLVARSTQDGSTVLDAALRPGQIRIQSARLQLSAALLGTLSPTLRAADLSGQCLLQAKDVLLEKGRASGTAQLAWQGAGSSLSRIRPLGSYQLLLSGQGNGLEFRLMTLAGPLSLDGSGHWLPNQKSTYQITATPTEATRRELVPLLRMMGRETTPGSYQLTMDRNMGAVSSH